MKKIPTLFKRTFENHKVVGITNEITPGCEEAFLHGKMTTKFDGSCCAIIDGVFYKRYDAKKGKKPPEGAIPCCEPDPITGHHPHWVKVDPENPADKWFIKALDTYKASIDDPEDGLVLNDGTYEAIGLHFQGNPYNLDHDILVRHGKAEWIFLTKDRTFETIRDFLRDRRHEGLVFWLDGEPVCKIKRTDFGFEWPIKGRGKEE